METVTSELLYTIPGNITSPQNLFIQIENGWGVPFAELTILTIFFVGFMGFVGRGFDKESSAAASLTACLIAAVGFNILGILNSNILYGVIVAWALSVFLFYAKE